MIKDEVARQKAKDIREIWGFFHTTDRDVQKIIGVLTGLRDKAAVSKLSAAYLDIHQVSLINDIQNNLSDEQVRKILSSVSLLANYTIA